MALEVMGDYQVHKGLLTMTPDDDVDAGWLTEKKTKAPEDHEWIREKTDDNDDREDNVRSDASSMANRCMCVGYIIVQAGRTEKYHLKC